MAVIRLFRPPNHPSNFTFFLPDRIRTPSAKYHMLIPPPKYLFSFFSGESNICKIALSTLYSIQRQIIACSTQKGFPCLSRIFLFRRRLRATTSRTTRRRPRRPAASQRHSPPRNRTKPRLRRSRRNRNGGGDPPPSFPTIGVVAGRRYPNDCTHDKKVRDLCEPLRSR